jgi:uncharacterized protein YjbJ (UPF0337 family)
MGMNKDQVKGRGKEAEGKVQETVGEIVGNKREQARGNVTKNLGQLQAKVGDVKQDLKDSNKGA